MGGTPRSRAPGRSASASCDVGTAVCWLWCDLSASQVCGQLEHVCCELLRAYRISMCVLRVRAEICSSAAAFFVARLAAARCVRRLAAAALLVVPHRVVRCSPALCARPYVRPSLCRQRAADRDAPHCGCRPREHRTREPAPQSQEVTAASSPARAIGARRAAFRASSGSQNKTFQHARVSYQIIR